MSIHYNEWRGYFAASPTPFTENGDVDLAALRSVLSWFLGARPHGMVVNGTTGEWFAQTFEERQRVLETARDIVPTETPLLVGISSIIPDESVRLGKHAEAFGADGVLLTIPPGRRLTDDDIFRFYEGIAAQVSLPMLIYNVPGVAGYDLPPALLCRLQTIDGVVGVKDNTPSSVARIETLRTIGKDRTLFSDVLEPESFSVFANEGCGRGQIGSGMPLGAALAEAFELVWKGQAEAARQIVERFTQFKADIVSALGPGQPWHAQMKALMFAMGVDAGYPRFPTTSMRDDQVKLAQLRSIISKYV